jgi:hypothetical protein
MDKLFKLNLTLQQINKVARYALNSTMMLAHYNPISSNVKVISLLIVISKTIETCMIGIDHMHMMVFIGRHCHSGKTLFCSLRCGCN